MIKTTKQIVDTCGCVLLYEWDTELPEEQRVHTAVEQTEDGQHQVVRCPVHQIQNVQEHLEAVIESNQKANLVRNRVLELAGEATFDKQNDEGELEKTFKVSFTPVVAYKNNGDLEVWFPKDLQDKTFEQTIQSEFTGVVFRYG